MQTNTLPPKKNSSQQRFIETLAESDLFKQYEHAFHTLAGLPLSLRAQGDKEFVEHTVSRKDLSGVVQSSVPVRVGKTPVALLETGGVRLEPANAKNFAPVASAMLDDNRTANEVRAAQLAFQQLPVMEPDRYEAALELLRSFAVQLGEGAHRLLFAHATHEPEAVRNAKIYIHAHLKEPMTLESVAGAVNVSPFHFCKIFKRATGLTFTDFVSRARVEKAKRMLMKPAARITDVAYDVGFQSLSHFNRCFRRIATESPTEFRQRMKQGAGLTASGGRN
jgi:AraC-like DNA-binding protein